MNKKFEQEIVVTKEMLASSMGSGMVDVFATPYMIAKMEETCSLCVKDDIGEGNATVGTLVNVAHISPTPEGMNVRFTAELIQQEGKLLDFKVEAFDNICKIGEGTHQRAIINVARFHEKTQAKK